MKIIVFLIVILSITACNRHNAYKWTMSDQYVFDVKGKLKDSNKDNIGKTVDIVMSKYYEDWQSDYLWCDWVTEKDGSINVSFEIPLMIYETGPSSKHDYLRNRALVRDAFIFNFVE